MTRNHRESTNRQDAGSRQNDSSQSKCTSRWLNYAAAGAAAATSAAAGHAAVLVDQGNLDLSGGPFTLAPGGSLALDLDNNGTTDITFGNLSRTSFSGSSGSAYGGRGFANGSVLGAYGGFYYTNQYYNYANRFSKVSSIGPDFTTNFVSPRPSNYEYTIQPGTQFYMRDGGSGWPLSGWGSAYDSYNMRQEANERGFLGVQFDIDGNTHYGFVDLIIDTSVLNIDGVPANVPQIFRYGYEDVPDTQISSLGDENADFDGDGDVDGDDFLTMQQGVGLASPTPADGDANSDGVVDGQDFSIWNAQFSPAQSAAAAVPEPNSLGLMALGATGLTVLRRTRKARSPGRGNRDKKV